MSREPDTLPGFSGDRSAGPPGGFKLIGLTGGIGMGKSAAAATLEQWGLPVCDTDLVARRLVAPGEPALGEIAAAFGRDVLDEGGRLRREILAARVFADREARQRLEAILHPRIRASWLAEADSWRRTGLAAGVVVIPLLFETGAEESVDVTVCVACSAEVQRERLRERGWSDEQLAGRLAAQWPIERKMAAADFVIWNDGDRTTLAEQLRRILRTLELACPAAAASCGAQASPKARL
ncbi:MAG: dephospho-CoA kinase [Verrucomicrobia bacterium]|jgi:dephospho-CoA kinase|nr:dephospho-CoA kinase [Verrucomicrobiota bacterium]